jgi:DMSO/TMAO reductase YedYZ molybdopterin-dependent catalytic subunit
MIARVLKIAAIVSSLTLIPHLPSGRARESGPPPGELIERLLISSPDNQAEIATKDFDKLPRSSVKVTLEGGTKVEYGGFELAEVLKLVGVRLGADLRGPALARYALVEAADGYHVVFSLPELDRELSNRTVLLADRRDGEALDAKEGPLRIVIPDEKRHARWVRQVTAIHVREAPRISNRDEE